MNRQYRGFILGDEYCYTNRIYIQIKIYRLFGRIDAGINDGIGCDASAAGPNKPGGRTASASFFLAISFALAFCIGFGTPPIIFLEALRLRPPITADLRLPERILFERLGILYNINTYYS
jgi:hypothetical protein